MAGSAAANTPPPRRHAPWRRWTVVRELGLERYWRLVGRMSGQSMRLRAYRAVRRVLLVFIAVSIANLIFSSVFYTPKMSRLLRRGEQMTQKYHLLQERIRTEARRLEEIHHRDNHVYRALFAADTLNITGIYTPYPAAKYAHLQQDDYADLMTRTWLDLDALARQLYRTSLSLDELQILSRNKENMTLAIPAIWPIDRESLRGGIGPFGYRNHPIYHRRILHKGVDLAAHIGDAVYATGEATVREAEVHGGYGKQILLDHQFGYRTRYAHLSEIFVRPGQKVSRGELIGRVGNTGASTGPHLHYEVIYGGAPVNPINYFNKNMSNEEYERLMSQMRDVTLDANYDQQ